MSGVNKAIILGNLGNDPEVKYTPDGKAIANITIATSENWKDKNSGEKVEKTEWHRIVAFGRLAEIMGEYLKKGSKIYIEGKLQTRKWEKEGQNHYSTEIIANQMQMLDSKAQSGGNAQQQAVDTGRGDTSANSEFDQDIPFMSYEFNSVI